MRRLAAVLLLISSTTACITCNMTEKADARQAEILGRMKNFLGIRPEQIERMMTDEMLQNARLDVQRDMAFDDDENLEKPESIHAYASGNADPEQPAAVFAFSHKTSKRTVGKAHLGVHLRRPSLRNSLVGGGSELYGVTIDVFERTPTGEVGDLVAKTKVNLPLDTEFSHTTVPLDTDDVQRWLQEGGVALYVVANVGEENLAVLPDDEDSSLKKVSLAMKVEGVPRRRKRQAHCTLDMKEKGCCLYDLVVDFEQIGWKFIIAPLKYNAYMCSGDCAHSKKDTMYGQLDGTSRLRATNYNGACCHPESYDALDVIYLNDKGEVITTKIPNMLVTKCSCG